MYCKLTFSIIPSSAACFLTSQSLRVDPTVAFVWHIYFYFILPPHPLCECGKFTKAQSTMSRLGDCLPEKHQGTLIIIFDIYDGKHLRYNVELELWLQMRRPRAPQTPDKADLGRRIVVAIQNEWPLIMCRSRSFLMGLRIGLEH